MGLFREFSSGVGGDWAEVWNLEGVGEGGSGETAIAGSK